MSLHVDREKLLAQVEAGKLAKVTLRFLSFVEEDPVTGCWVWQATIGRGGYGYFTRDDRLRLAHRQAWEIFVGPIPEGYEIDHVCKNRACVRPETDHLEPVTKQENMRRIRRAECRNGHAYTPENTYQSAAGRQCRACMRASWRRYDARRNGATK